MSESENDQFEESRGPRFSKAIIGRILAVACFIALGTFAVMHSMGKSKTNVANGGEPPNTKQPGDVDETINNGFENNTEKPKTSVTAKFGDDQRTGTVPEASKPKGIAPNFGSNTFGAKPNVSKTGVASTQHSPSTKTGFGPAVPNTFGADTKNSNQNKTSTSPPPRYAQAGGIPVIGNKNGFGTRADALKKSVTGAIDQTAKSTADALNKAKTSASDKATDLLNSTKQKLGTATNDLRKSFGPSVPPANSSTTKKSTFGPLPKVNSEFGPTNSQAASATGQPKAPAIKTPAKLPSSKPPAITQAKTSTQTQPPIVNSNTFGGAPSVRPIKSANTTTQRGQTSPFGAPDLSKSGSSRPNIVSAPAIPNMTQSPATKPPAPANGFGSTQSSRLPNTGFGNQRTTQSKPSVQPLRPNNSIPARPASTTLTPSSRIGSSSTITAGLLTQNVPGDRQLDGVQAPSLAIEKLAPREIQVNQSADFQIVVKNVGRVTAEDVRVFDKVPEGAELIDAMPKPQLTRSRDLEWQIGRLRPGQEHRIKLQLKPIRPGELGSVAHVTFAAQASMRVQVTKPVLEITHSSKRTHLIGDDVVFDVTVQNKGDGPAKNVLIQENVPKQLEFQEGYRELEYEVGTLMPGQSRRVQLALKAANIGKLRNIMFASADGGLSAKHEIDMEVIAPNLVTKAKGPTLRYLKRSVTHEFSVKNDGTAKATNVELIARLPSGLRFTSANNQGSYRAATHSVHWSLAELERDVDAVVELKTVPVDVGNQPIKFESFADLNVRSTAEQPLKVEHLVDVFFDIDDVVDPIEIGSSTSYQIRVVNQGTKTASNVQLQVTFPNGLQPTSVDGSLQHKVSGQNILFEPINTMSPGDEISFVVHGTGRSAGDHRVVVSMRTDGRSTPVAKEETTRVYSDR